MSILYWIVFWIHVCLYWLLFLFWCRISSSNLKNWKPRRQILWLAFFVSFGGHVTMLRGDSQQCLRNHACAWLDPGCSPARHDLSQLSDLSSLEYLCSTFRLDQKLCWMKQSTLKITIFSKIQKYYCNEFKFLPLLLRSLMPSESQSLFTTPHLFPCVRHEVNPINLECPSVWRNSLTLIYYWKYFVRKNLIINNY